MAVTELTSSGLEIGREAPAFVLPDTDGVEHGLTDPEEAKATVVIFTCNHCPYALAWHDRLMAVASDYADRGVRFFAINSNDAERYPADSYQAMKEAVARQPWPMPYLRDESQDVARSWGAKTTPDVFVVDSKLCLRYRGAPDADYEDPSQDASWLRAALEDLLAGKDVRQQETEPVGCSVKWKI